MKSTTALQRSRPRQARPKDKEIGKRFPNSLSATLRGVRLLSKAENSKAFAKEFKPAFDEVFTLYPGSGKSPRGLKGIIERTEAGVPDLPYYLMRAYAQHLEIPTGLLLLFSHVVGDVVHGANAGETRDFIDQNIDALRVLRGLLSTDDLLEKIVPDASPAQLEEGKYNIATTVLDAYVSEYRKSAQRREKRRVSRRSE